MIGMKRSTTLFAVMAECLVADGHQSRSLAIVDPETAIEIDQSAEKKCALLVAKARLDYQAPEFDLVACILLPRLRVSCALHPINSRQC